MTTQKPKTNYQTSAEAKNAPVYAALNPHAPIVSPVSTHLAVSPPAKPVAAAQAPKPEVKKPTLGTATAKAKTGNTAKKAAASGKTAKPITAKASTDSPQKPAAKPASATPTLPGNTASLAGYTALQEQQERWVKGMAIASEGAAVVHSKIADFVRDQTDSTIHFWKKILTADSLAEVVVLQTQEVRRQFETSSQQLKDIAQTTSHAITKALASASNTQD